MSSPTLTRPLTASVFLRGDSRDENTGKIIARSLRKRDVTRPKTEPVRHLSTSALWVVESRIGAVADGLLGFDLGSVLVSGWRKYTDLIRAAERTLAVPGSEEVVILATHKVSSIHHPSVELLVDEAKVYTFVFDLTVEFDLTGVVAVVRRGELVALRGGECVITATLTYEDAPLVPQQQRSIDLAVVVPLRPAIPLIQEGEALP